MANQGRGRTVVLVNNVMLHSMQWHIWGYGSFFILVTLM